MTRNKCKKSFGIRDFILNVFNEGRSTAHQFMLSDYDFLIDYNLIAKLTVKVDYNKFCQDFFIKFEKCILPLIKIANIDYYRMNYEKEFKDLISMKIDKNKKLEEIEKYCYKLMKSMSYLLHAYDEAYEKTCINMKKKIDLKIKERLSKMPKKINKHDINKTIQDVINNTSHEEIKSDVFYDIIKNYEEILS